MESVDEYRGPKQWRRLAVLAALVSTMTMIGACRSDEERPTTSDEPLTTTSGEPLTTDEFLLQANAICKSSDRLLLQAAQQLFPDWPETIPAQRATFVRIAGGIVEGRRDDLAALLPPEDLQDEVDQLRAEGAAAFDELTDDPDLLLRDENPFADADALAAEIGLKACTSDWTPAQG